MTASGQKRMQYQRWPPFDEWCARIDWYSIFLLMLIW